MAWNFQIGEIARFFDVPASTLRYWEDMGVVHPAKGAENHYREYSIEDLMTISDIVFYKNLGLQLKEIRGIKDLTPEGIEQALLRQNMTTRVETALKDTALVTGPDGVTDYVIPEFRLTDFSAPLGRSYEIRFRILFPNAGPWFTEQ